MHQLSDHIDEISDICSSHSVKHLFAFGSVLTDRFSIGSDIDLLVEFLPIQPSEYADNYYDLKFSLEGLLKRKVDLLEEKALKNPYFLQAVEKQKALVYGY
jgi:predicted nucleotidyltransferase